MSLKLSIITINYNNLIGLEKTINSVFEQTWKDFEYIVIDGGSTDGSKEIIEKFSSSVDYWISENDSGVYNAMNKGIKVAKGDYLLFLNSGDFLYSKNVLQEFNKYFDSINQIVYGKSAFYEKDNFNRNFIPPKRLNFIYFINAGLNHQATFIKKSLFEENFYYNESYKISSDWEFFLYTICIKRVKYLFVDEFVCKYDITGMSSNPKTNKYYISEREEVLNKYFPFLKDDFDVLKELGDKRIKNILYIKKFNFPWKILKSFAKIILVFLPKREE